nr:acetate kinase [Zoogloeaceae bacterium]
MKAILVLNAGSSSLKFALYPINGELAATPAISGQIEGIGAKPELKAKGPDGKRVTEAVKISGEHGEQHRDALTHLFGWLAANNPALDV